MDKKLFLVLFMLVIGHSVFSQIVYSNDSYTRSGTTLGKSQNQSARFKPNYFNSKEDAVANKNTGNYSYYIASDRRTYRNRPVDGVNRVPLPLEADAVVQMVTVYGIKWVILQAGTMCRYEVGSDGYSDFVPYALDECGNDIFNMSYLTPPASNQTYQNYQPQQNFGNGEYRRQEAQVITYSTDPCCGGSQALSLNTYSNRGRQVFGTGTLNQYQLLSDQATQSYGKDNKHRFVKGLIGTAILVGVGYLILKKDGGDGTTIDTDNGNDGDHQVITLPEGKAITDFAPKISTTYAVQKIGDLPKPKFPTVIQKGDIMQNIPSVSFSFSF